jgi:hypothetical protein
MLWYIFHVLGPSGRALMTRDMELIRKIISEIQSWRDVQMQQLEVPDHDSNVVGHHVEMLIDTGYVTGKIHYTSMGRVPFVTDLTSEGHDFAAAI